MTNQQTPNRSSLDKTGTNKRSRGAAILKFAAGTVIVILAISVFAYWMTNRPKARMQKPKSEATLVQTVEIQSGSHPVTVRAMGTVLPAEQVQLVAQVSGQLVKVSPKLIPGGHLQRNDVLARIDQRDYKLSVSHAKQALRQAEYVCEERKLAIKQKLSQIAEAEKSLTLEKAKREVALGEYDMLIEHANSNKFFDVVSGGDTLLESSTEGNVSVSGPLTESITESEKQLILREPYLNARRAALEAARAAHQQAQAAHQNAQAARDQAETALEKARLNLEWTTLKAPFDAVVQTKNIGAGSYVSPGKSVATLVNTNLYWIEVSVPVNQLKWIDFPVSQAAPDTAAKIFYETAWGSDIYRIGTIKQIKPGIETMGRMARLIVEVTDPLSLRPENRNKPALMLDSRVTARISGTPIQNAVKLPRTALREGNYAWVLAANGTLDIRPVTIAARTPEYVLVTDGLQAGMRLITSDIPTPVEGMKLREKDAPENPRTPLQ